MGEQTEQDPIFRRLTAKFSGERLVRGLFVSGSYGRGTADVFSDFDFLVVADAEQHTMVATRAREILEQVAETVFWNERRFDGVLLNAIAADWQRYDFFIATVGDFSHRTRDSP